MEDATKLKGIHLDWAARIWRPWYEDFLGPYMINECDWLEFSLVESCWLILTRVEVTVRESSPFLTRRCWISSMI